MAEFSKQWVEENDQDMVYDFDIFEIADGLENGFYTSIICEGFGFIAIGKDENGAIILAVPTGEHSEEENSSAVVWVPLNDMLSK